MIDASMGVIGSGSWATALVKILTDNNHTVHWCVRNEKTAAHIQTRSHNPSYLPSVYFDTTLLRLSTDIKTVVLQSDCLLVAVPSAYVVDTLKPLSSNAFSNKKILSAIKGMVPDQNLLFNEYLLQQYQFPLKHYFTLMGPCHAEEVAAEKLSYLTFSGVDEMATAQLAALFSTSYINMVVNNDVYGVQYAAIMKNIYALGAGIAHGLGYGDNFLSVLIANCADEMAGFLKKAGIVYNDVGVHEKVITQQKSTNYAASVYLGDLLVTCYSLHSRNRSFGTMIGKGYSVKSAQLEMNMVAEGYNASKCLHILNQIIQATMPIANAVYNILWQNSNPTKAFMAVEGLLV
jgi:glycerol-3-phosphate dehydrogenase (NAD(P)+)